MPSSKHNFCRSLQSSPSSPSPLLASPSHTSDRHSCCLSPQLLGGGGGRPSPLIKYQVAKCVSLWLSSLFRRPSAQVASVSLPASHARSRNGARYARCDCRYVCIIFVPLACPQIYRHPSMVLGCMPVGAAVLRYFPFHARCNPGGPVLRGVQPTACRRKVRLSPKESPILLTCSDVPSQWPLGEPFLFLVQ